MVGDYLKRWYGMRAAQCKALLPMLSWVDHPAAIQLLLSTARRFRTAGIRKEAERCVKLLAERPPLTSEAALPLAAEHFAFCDECGGRGLRYVSAIAGSLAGAPLWTFWWD